MTILNFKRILFVTLATAAVNCSKKDSNSDTSSSDDLVLMQQLEISCGTNSECFGAPEASSLRLSNDQTAIQTMQMFAWIALGFPSDLAYKNTLGDNPSDAVTTLVPKAGLVSKIEGIRSTLVASVKSQYPTMSSCSSAPTSGDFTDTDGNTVTWMEASMTAPASFPEDKAGKTYDKAISYTSKDGLIKTHFEFFCDYNGMASVMTILDDDGKTTMDKYALYYDRETSTKLYVDFYLLDDSSTVSSGTLELAVQLRSLEENKMQAWVSRTGKDDDKGIQGYRYAVNANLETDKISYAVLNNDTGYTQTEWDALSTNSSTAVTGGAAYGSGSSTNNLKNGCAEGWNASTNSSTSATLCSGLSLEEAPAPALDADGSSSLKWIRANLRTLLEAL